MNYTDLVREIAIEADVPQSSVKAVFKAAADVLRARLHVRDRIKTPLGVVKVVLRHGHTRKDNGGVVPDQVQYKFKPTGVMAVNRKDNPKLWDHFKAQEADYQRRLKAAREAAGAEASFPQAPFPRPPERGDG